MPVTESALSVQLGLDRPELVKLRKTLIRGEHWDKDKAAVIWLDEGIAAARAHYNIPDDSPPLVDDSKPQGPTFHNATVVSTFRNQRILDARLPDGTIARVLVRNSYYYGKHEPIRVRADIDGSFREAAPPKPRRGRRAALLATT